MITRVIHTDIFKDKNFRKLNADTKMFYLTLILNDEIGQSRIYKCSDEFLAIYSGLTLTQVDKCKDDLEVAQMAILRMIMFVFLVMLVMLILIILVLRMMVQRLKRLSVFLVMFWSIF